MSKVSWQLSRLWGRLWGHYAFSSRVMASLLTGTIGGMSIGAIVMPAQAAEKVNVRLGPFQQTVPVEDIERYAETGEISENLKPFAFWLTPDVRRVLGDKLEVNPEQADKMMEELFKSPSGDRIIQALKLAVPGVSLEQLQGAVILAAQMANKVSIPSVLRALPGESITLDASALVAAISKIQLPYLGAKDVPANAQEQSNPEPQAKPASHLMQPR